MKTRQFHPVRGQNGSSCDLNNYDGAWELFHRSIYFAL
jgi:hypothetical protein